MGQGQGQDGDRTDDGGTDGRLVAGRYRLGAVLGKGGMGTVWRALDETLGRTVAVKELRFPHNIDEDDKRRLITRTLREANAAARIRNTGAVTVFDVVEEDDRPWIVMELVEGRSLSDAIREDGPLTPKRAAEVGLTVLDVLKAAHKEGILHRDVKPSNVLIADDGRVVLSDFGIAQIDGDPSVTSTGMLVGAPSYISPERARGQKPGPPADLWSLGALLYASVEGRPPYDRGSAIATLTAVMTEPLKEPANAGPLADAIHGLLIKDPAHRLDDDTVRPLLTGIVNAPDLPVEPAPDVTRAIPLTVDPQPVPTDAPPATRKAVADQARVRSALRAVRKTKPAPEPGPEPLPAQAPAESDGRRRRALVIVAIAVALAVLGTVIGFYLAATGGDNNDGSKKPVVKSTRSASTDSAKNTVGASASGSAAVSASATASSSVPASASGASSSIPAGYAMYSSDMGFSIALPDGWKHVGGYGDSNDGGAKFSARSVTSVPRVQVDWTRTPGKDAAAAWRASAKTAASRFSGYQKISIKTIAWRGYRTVADWEFRYTSGGTTMRAVNRGFVTDSTHGYAIFFIAPDADWNSVKIKKMRKTFFDTFKPAK
jgi:serine/threonine protein kinase